jgi:alpha-L-rhamnosidase
VRPLSRVEPIIIAGRHIYRHGTDIFNDPDHGHGDGHAIYQDGGALNDQGFSYEFVTPALMALPQAKVRDRRLAPDHAGYKALVVAGESALSIETIRRLDDYAQGGLSIVFAGSLPERSLSHAAQSAGGDAAVRSALASLLKRPSVIRVAALGDVPEALRRAGVIPDADAATPSGILTQHRTAPDGDFYYLYNYNKVTDLDGGTVGRPGKPTDRTIYPAIDREAAFQPRRVRFSLLGQGRPYLLNAWSGALEPVRAYSRDGDRVSLTLDFARDEAIIVGLIPDEHETPGTDAHASADIPANGIIAYRSGTVLLGDPASASSQRITVADWTLRVDSLEQSASGSPSFADTQHRQLGPFAIGERLRSWRLLDPALTAVSGVGTYHASFDIEPRSVPRAALLRLGAVEDSFTLSVNGKSVTGLDPTAEVVDISDYVRPGRNSIAVTVSTTLANAVRNAGKDYGILGVDGRVQVEIVPLVRVPAAQPPAG